MKRNSELVKNAAGRLVPTIVNGKKGIPFKGVNGYFPDGNKTAPPIKSCSNYPLDGNKLLGTLKEALIKSGITDGMTISSHHHFRNGDLVMNQVFDIAAELGIKNLRWFPSAAFPCHKPMIKYMEDGVIHHIEGSLNGPLGQYASEGKMNGLAVLRSHGGRWQSIQDGEVHIDIAIIAAPTADSFGNATGDRGPSACGLLGFGLADSMYADNVIVVTDNLVPFPCIPWQIQGNNVDYVVQLEKVGEPEKIVSGTTKLTRSPDRIHIAELTAKFVRAAGIMKDGFSFQAGAGGTSLAFAIYLKEMMKDAGIKARFIRGGSTKYLVEMLEEGLTDYILDGQTFDLDGVRSMRENHGHVNTSPFTSYNWHGKGNFAGILDAVVLGATEVDINFNANVVTHSDGLMLHGIGGWQNCLFSKCTILPIPAFRNRVPIIVDKVTTLVGPGELIDVIVTERGIAINPKRTDLIESTKDSGLPIRTIHELKNEIDDLVGGAPDKPEFSDEVIGVVKWVDGTILDSIFKLKKYQID
ncbi:MAG: citrate lyase subunit alpha [Candidatus Marinimicrobia bacterium]|jgi:citrate lyase subunit alpha/citrate CoA-transferase|nr:citrate lyase subunit alpha [Candidatus Neomarinimicrobiota bacterium]MBT3634238.1 citrate lyase subunit alpha [Candidatus Neomarinimicrobiota bacterium]MBT3682963.1 citrate lyase subunit alpha [Candidatus Neomarinimicrobiota bacterium]MBT3760047.1 citrate lyase subunit alpha [Candidatus Neomarinimicrobiota bacterium]MBT3896186.1 citrate lyase subunit alpha [Candidatus Neomarinimicrobiota bacterium]